MESYVTLAWYYNTTWDTQETKFKINYQIK
jgi:hypothetical protein